MTIRFLMNDRKEKAMKAFNAGGYKRGGHVTEIAIVMGMPKGMKKHDMRHKFPVKKALGGPLMSNNNDVAAMQDVEALQNIKNANQLLQNGMGLKKGGIAKKGHVKNRMCKAEGGLIGLSRMANRDLDAGKMLTGLKKGGDVRMAAGGVGKIRKYAMSKSGKPLPASFSRKYCKDT